MRMRAIQKTYINQSIHICLLNINVSRIRRVCKEKYILRAYSYLAIWTECNSTARWLIFCLRWIVMSETMFAACKFSQQREKNKQKSPNSPSVTMTLPKIRSAYLFISLVFWSPYIPFNLHLNQCKIYASKSIWLFSAFFSIKNTSSTDISTPFILFAPNSVAFFIFVLFCLFNQKRNENRIEEGKKKKNPKNKW